MELVEHFYDNVYQILDANVETVKDGRKNQILNIPAVFDIESTSFYEDKNKRCCMYAWVFGLNGKCIRGRTWKEFLDALKIVERFYDLSSRKRLIIYVHNLSFEFQWIRKWFNWERVFSLEERKPIYAITTTGIEFRCSYLMSGYSLDNLGKKLTYYKVQKKTGDLDYSKYRHSNTPLTDLEWQYVLYDGLVVMAYIQEEIDRIGSIKELPLTKTGYVRTYCRERCIAKNNNYRNVIKHLTLDADVYVLLKKAFAGGFTHANHNWVDKNIFTKTKMLGVGIESIGSFDLTSSYPTTLVSEKFPMSKPIKVNIDSIERFKRLIKNYNCLFTITFENIEPLVDFEHYISSSKCEYLENETLDNGRVVSADKLTITITEIDFEIIRKFYKWNIFKISEFYYFHKGYLPQEFVKIVLDLYEKKTTLKDIEESVVDYMLSKEMLNSLYGMCVTDICRDDIMYEDYIGWHKEKPELQEMLDKYNKSGNRFLYYPWGVWVTAYARRNLFEMLYKCANDYIYADTDSLKVINYEKYLKAFEEYNNNIIMKIKQCLNYYHINVKRAKPKNKNGVEKPLGVWDFEGRLSKFKTLGAKRYIYEKDNEEHKIVLTISGVNKTNGVEYLKHKFKTNEKIFKNFTDKLVFPAEYTDKKVIKKGSGKLTHTYIDDYISGTLVDYLGNEGTYEELSGVHLESTSYNMSLTDAFKNYLFGTTNNWTVYR